MSSNMRIFFEMSETRHFISYGYCLFAQKKQMKTKAVIILFLFACTIAKAQTLSEQTRKQHFNLDKNGLAIQGYDPVTYIAEQMAKEGKPELSYSYKGATYYFSGEGNKKLFTADPEKYEPVYGGWCAYAMNYAGKKVEIDPKTFKVIGGKTFLFYNFYFNNTLTDWNKDEAAYKVKADANWKKIVGQ